MKKLKFERKNLYLSLGSYTYSGNLAICADFKDEYFGDITTNLMGFNLKKDEAFLDPLVKPSGVYDLLVKEGLIKKVVRKNVRFNMEHYDLVKFDLEKLKEYDPKGYQNYMNLNEDYDIDISPSI